MSDRYRVFIVDDETLARRRLRQLLANAPDFDVVGESGDAVEAATLIADAQPDVVFLDIQMPNLDGFGVREAITRRAPFVVFVTAHPEHAARAFDVAAADYLVKPVTQARFDDALQRLRRARGAPGEERVLLGSRLGGRTVPRNEIVWLEAQGAYTVAYTATDNHVVRESLAALAERLGPRFLRVHRSAAVNLAHAIAVRRSRTSLALELSNGKRIPISRRMASSVLAMLRTGG